VPHATVRQNRKVEMLKRSGKNMPEPILRDAQRAPFVIRRCRP
jgi:hypothetical protein